MTFWQKHKWKIIVPVLIVLVLAAAFVFGDRNMPKQKDTSAQPTVAAPVETPEQDAAADEPDDEYVVTCASALARVSTLP